MKHLLSCTALASALAFTAPVWAQAPTPQYPSGTPSPPGAYTQPPPATYGNQPPQYQQPAAPPYSQQPKPSAPYAGKPDEPMPSGKYTYRHKRYTGYKGRMYHGRYGRGPTDNIANQLNRAELNQLAGGGGMPPGGYSPPRPVPQGYPPAPPPRY